MDMRHQTHIQFMHRLLEHSTYILLPILSIILWGAMQRHKPPHNQADGQPQERSRDEMKENAEPRKKKKNRTILSLIITILVLWLSIQWSITFWTLQ